MVTIDRQSLDYEGKSQGGFVSDFSFIIPKNSLKSEFDSSVQEQFSLDSFVRVSQPLLEI